MKNTIKRNRIYFALVVILFAMASLALLLVMSPKTSTVYADSNDDIISYKRYTPTLADDFEDNKIIVTLKRDFSQVNKVIDNQIFSTEHINSSINLDSDSQNDSTISTNDIIIKSIEDLTYFSDPSVLDNHVGFNQILSIELQEHNKQKVLDAITELEALDFVLAAEPSYNYIAVDDWFHADDTYFPEQWALDDENGISIQSSWSITRGSSTPNIKVGIFENSVQSNHPDLRVVPGNFVPSDETASAFHGTHVAGIIGAITNNNLGISGIAQVEIALLNRRTFVDSLTWAIANDIKIINASFYYIKSGTANTPAESSIAHAQALRMFGENGGLFIASAGNSNSNTDNTPQYPSGYADKRKFPDINNVISVGAIDINGNKTSFSCYGQNSVQIYAPGEDILSTFPTSLCIAGTCFRPDYGSHFDNGYHYMDGTSMAAPQVTGVAALLLSNSPNLSTKQIKEFILDNATKITINTSSGNQVVKKLNAYNAIARSINLFDTTDLSSTTTEITKVNLDTINELVIPTTIQEKTVVSIGSLAFSHTKLASVVIPDTILYIKDHAFSDCNSLTNISIPSSVTTIEHGAFAGCDNLTFTVDSNNPNYTAANGILYNKSKNELVQACKITDTFIVPNTISKISPYAFEYNSNLNTVSFNCNPEVGNNAFANCINLETVYFDTYTAPIAGVDVFKGKVPTIIVPYNAQNAFKQSFSQYSDYITSEQFAVDFICNGQVIESKRVYNGSTIEDLPTPPLTGYDFGGWYDNPNYTGEPYKNGGLWESDTTITLYAKTTPQDCTIVFDANGGTIIGDNYMVVKYGSTFTTSITAQKAGNDLNGWYDNNKIKYVTADGRSTRQWDKPGITTLKADWSPKSYEIQINNDGSITWLSNNGLSDKQCYIQYGTVLSAINLIAIYKKSAQGFKEGNIFDHFEYKGSSVDWTSVPDLGENGSVITIEPIWKLEEHTIYFHTLCNVVVNKIEALYETEITLPTPSRTGYTFNGWYTAETGGTKVNWPKMPDLTPTDQNNGSTMLYAHWTAIKYRIYYNANGGSGTMNYTEHTYGTEFNLPTNKFTKTEHIFAGWATSANGDVLYTDGQKVRDLAKTQGASVTLYARWDAKRYTITYKNLTSDLSVSDDCYYLYGVGKTILPTPQFMSQSGPPTNVEHFYGWYTSTDFTSQVTYISTTQTGNITLYAKYDYLLAHVGIVGTYTVTDAGTAKNPKIDIDVSLESTYYSRIQNTTLKKAKIVLSFNLWEIDDGYQHVYLRNDKSGATLWQVKIDHSGNKKKYTYSFEIDIEKLKNTDSITFLFDASGWGSDTWKFESFDARICLTN